jgi:hypothetical protein
MDIYKLYIYIPPEACAVSGHHHHLPLERHEQPHAALSQGGLWSRCYISCRHKTWHHKARGEERQLTQVQQESHAHSSHHVRIYWLTRLVHEGRPTCPPAV